MPIYTKFPKEACSMVEQKYQTNLVKPAKLKYEHKTGESVRKVDLYFDKENNEQIWFTAPKVDGLYFKKAEELLNDANHKRNDVKKSKGLVNPKDPQQGNAFINENAVFEFFSIASAGIILLFSSVEANINNAIETCKDVNYFEKKDKTIFKIWKLIVRFRQTSTLTKEEILFLDINTKLKKVLPKLYNFESPANENFWQKFSELKKIRDSLIHITSTKSYGASNYKNSVYAELMDLDFDELLNAIRNLIYYIDNNVHKT